MKYDLNVQRILNQVTKEDIERVTNEACDEVIDTYSMLDNYLDVLFLITSYRKLSSTILAVINGIKPIPSISKGDDLNSIIKLEKLYEDIYSLNEWNNECLTTNIGLINANILKYREFLNTKLKQKGNV